MGFTSADEGPNVLGFYRIEQKTTKDYEFKKKRRASLIADPYLSDITTTYLSDITHIFFVKVSKILLFLHWYSYSHTLRE